MHWREAMKRTCVFLICLLAGCGTSDESTVELTLMGGFAPGLHNSVLISGNEVTYRLETVSETAELKRSDREAILNAFDDIDFLSLELHESDCTSRGADFPTATLRADLPAGSNVVEYDTGCEGAVYDQLETLNAVIYEISGYNRWLAARVVPFRE